MRQQCEYRGRLVADKPDIEYYECLATRAFQERCKCFNSYHGLCVQDVNIPPGAMRRLIGDRYVTIRGK